MATIGSQADGRGEFPGVAREPHDAIVMRLCRFVAASTTVKLCYDAQALHLHYEAKDEKLFLNHYPKCNTDMWNNEVLPVLQLDLFAAAYILLPQLISCLHAGGGDLPGSV